VSATAIVIIVILAAVIVLIAGTAFFLQNRRRRDLHRRYGHEYDRAVQQAGSVRAGEADLRERVEAREVLPIHPLTTDQVDRYRDEWEQVQSEFVDTPSGSLRHADAVVTAIMVDRGYPMSEFEQQAKLISVDHASVVENYRLAHETFLENERDRVPTDQVRDAIVAYRSLFEELIAVDDGQDSKDERSQTRVSRSPR